MYVKRKQAYCLSAIRPLDLFDHPQQNLSIVLLGTVARIVLRAVLAAVLRVVLVVVASVVLRTVLAVVARIVLIVILVAVGVVLHLVVRHDITS